MSSSIKGKYIPLAVRRRVRYTNREKKVWPKTEANLKLQFHAKGSVYPAMTEKQYKLFIKRIDAFLPAHRKIRPRARKVKPKTEKFQTEAAS